MRFSFTNEKEGPVDQEIKRIHAKMQEEEVNTLAHTRLMLKLERLYEIKAHHRPERVSRDTLAMVFGNLALTLIIVAYEQKHVIASKGFNQLIRPKAP